MPKNTFEHILGKKKYIGTGFFNYFLTVARHSENKSAQNQIRLIFTFLKGQETQLKTTVFIKVEFSSNLLSWRLSFLGYTTTHIWMYSTCGTI